MLGPLLAMPSGQGLNMTLLAILKVNRANWLLVLEIKLELRKNVSTIDKISLLVRQHYICWIGAGFIPWKGLLERIFSRSEAESRGERKFWVQRNQEIGK